MTTTAKKAADDTIKIVKTGSCASLSGRTKLTYEFGIDDQAAWHVRIAKSSGTGFFSRGWVLLEHVQRVLDKNARKPVTCHTLGPIFKGKSVNTAGFLLAALKDVGLIQTNPDNPRAYEVTDGKTFFAELRGVGGGAAKTLTGKKKPALKTARAQSD